MSTTTPQCGLQIHSRLGRDGTLCLSLDETVTPALESNEVLIAVEAAPINPSDLLTLFPGGEHGQLHAELVAGRPQLTTTLPPSVSEAFAGRFDMPLPVGLAGSGTVVAAGDNAQSWLGQRVTALSLSLGFFSQYCKVTTAECAILPDNVSFEEAADVFCNPMTALGIVETVKLEGHAAFIHTAAASNLGQMLVKICREDGIELVNIVRRQEQVELLRDLGAKYICNSSAPGFAEDLVKAIEQTGAMLAFDAIGGGTMVHQLLSGMETAAAARLPVYSPYGSFENKQVYVYGRLDRSPMYIEHGDYGVLWGVQGWVLPIVQQQIGQQRVEALKERILAGLQSTFASRYCRQLSLAEALDPATIQAYCRQSTGEKFLIRPSL